VTLFKAVVAIEREMAAIVKDRKSQLDEMVFDAKLRAFPVEFMAIKLLSKTDALAPKKFKIQNSVFTIQPFLIVNVEY